MRLDISCYLCAMREEAVVCPGCGKVVPDKNFRHERPFSCPSCREIVAVSDAYAGHSKAGCLVSFVSVMVIAAYIGLRGAHKYLVESVLIGFLLGVGLGLTTAIAISHGLNRLRPRALRLEKHIIREHPELMVAIAEFLESLAELEVWTSEQDRELHSLAKQESLDEPLVGTALFAASELKARLSGSRPANRKGFDEIRGLDLVMLRVELVAISGDLRIAGS